MDAIEEPQAKKMADNQILEAINGIKNSVAAMEQQLKAVPTKTDMANIVTEIKGVREQVIRNTDRIDNLFDLRKEDAEALAQRVERIVEGKIAGLPATAKQGKTGRFSSSENERAFLRSRRSVRLWPVTGSTHGELEKGVRLFMEKHLKISTEVLESLVIEKIVKQGQTRRSKIQDEVLILLETSQQRDIIQSYAFNLAAVQGKAGLRLDIPDFLRGTFRMFEEHAAALRTQYGVVKRAIRFDDIGGSLFMYIKLEDTEWHRVTAEEVNIACKKRNKKKEQQRNTHEEAAAQKKKILLDEGGSIPCVESDGESQEEFFQAN